MTFLTKYPRIDSTNVGDFWKFVSNNTIGSDYLVDGFNAARTVPNYPPYNLVRTGEDIYEITMAVAGFTRDDVRIEVNDRLLVIAGTKNHTETGEGWEFLVKGLALRDFRREFRLVEYMEVSGATMAEGILTILLKRELPEAAKPRLINIA